MKENKSKSLVGFVSQLENNINTIMFLKIIKERCFQAKVKTLVSKAVSLFKQKRNNSM